MSLKYVDELSLAENIVKTKEHVESVRAALDSAKQNIIEYATIPSPSEDVLGLFIIYTGATNSTYTHGYVYECVSDGGDPATYTWEQRNVQDGVVVDGVTIVKDANTDEISAVTATNSTKGIVKGSADVSIDADGAMTVNDRVKEVNALPTATVDLLDECYLLRSVQTGYDLGKIYQCQALEVVPEGTENPSEEGWYELDGTTYELSADTSVDAGKTYYEIKWVSISSANLEAGRGITIDGSVINANTNTFTGTQAEWDELSAEEKKEYDIANFTDDGETGDITDVVESGNHNPVESDAVFDSEQKLYKIDAAYGVKNLAPRLNSQTINNVTFDINDDGSVTVNGTATSDCWYNICGQDINNFLQAGENYIASGCPEGGSDTTFFMYIGGSYLKYVLDDTSFTCDAAKSGNFYICVRTNTVMDNVVFYPMIRHASYVDDTYEPYAKTNQQLTQETTGLIDSQNIDGCKNHFGMSLSNSVDNGITYQVNENNIITANGTVTASPSATVGTSGYITGLIVGETYVLSGLPESTTVSGGEAFIKLYKNDSSYSEIRTSSGSKTLTFTYDGTNARAIDVGIRTVGAVVTNAVFKPMICLKSLYDADPTFVPYAKSNKELTEIVAPLKTQFDADHIIVKTISDVMNIYWTDNAIPSDWSNLTTQQATDIAQALYDVFKKIGGAAWVRNTGIMRQTYRKASDGSELASSVLMVDLYSNSSYNSMLSNNASARFTLTMYPYGETSRITFSLWGNKLMFSSHGINNAGTVFDFDKLYTYNTISTYKG